MLEALRLRTLAACALPAVAISVAWLRIEQPRETREGLAVVALALAPALVSARWPRALLAAAGALLAAWIAFGAQPWELFPSRDERVLQPTAEAVGRGLADFYRVVLPFSPEGTPEMHALVLVAIFGFVLAVALLAASSRPVGAAAVTVVAAGWPATILGDGRAVALGALALAAALSTPLILRVRSGGSLVAGMAASVLVVAAATWASSATAVARDAAVNWESWDFSGVPVDASGVRFAWDSNYDGIEFPPTKTVVLTVEGPERARYWRTSTLDLFASDHWFEDLLWLSRVEPGTKAMPLDRLAPARAALQENWLEQKVEVRALVDDRLAAAGTPVALDSRRLGTVFRLSGSVLRARSPLGEGQRYRVWSYAPDPAPAALASSEPRYPSAAFRYLEVDGKTFPVFELPGREQHRPGTARRYRVRLPRCVCAALQDRAPSRPVSGHALWRGARARVLVQAAGRVRLRRAAAACRRPSACLLRDENEGGVLPALRGRDGPDAPHARCPRAGCGRLHEREARGWQVGRHRPRGTCLGRGLVRRTGLGPVRPDSGAGDVREHLLVRVGLHGCRRRASSRRPEHGEHPPRARQPERRDPTRGSVRRARAACVHIRGSASVWVLAIGLGKAILRRPAT